MFNDISSRVRNIMVNYDRNQNGTIDYTPKGKPGVNEATYTSTQPGTDRHNRPTERKMTFSIDKLVLAADTNKDGKATEAELAAVMARFDLDHDGDLPNRGLVDTLLWKPKQEGDRFEAAFPTKFTERTRVIKP